MKFLEIEVLQLMNFMSYLRGLGLPDNLLGKVANPFSCLPTFML